MTSLCDEKVDFSISLLTKLQIQLIYSRGMYEERLSMVLFTAIIKRVTTVVTVLGGLKGQISRVHGSSQ